MVHLKVFYIILIAMFATYYLTSFREDLILQVLFCRYKPLTHKGLLETIDEHIMKQTFTLNTLNLFW